MSSLLLALGASLAWGVADFVGPWQARALGALRVLAWAELAGLLSVALLVIVRGRGPEDWNVLLAVPAAIAGTLGIFAYYRGMAIGAMAVVAPIAGASAIIPVVAGIVGGDRPDRWQYAGIACAIVGVALASQEQQSGEERRLAAGVGLALLAAVGFGFYFPAMHAAAKADPYWSTLVFRLCSGAIVGTAVATRRPALRLPARTVVVLAGVGIGDAAGNAMFAGSASEGGLVSLTSVLASLYPIVTVLLAAAVLKEHVSRAQRIGVVLTLAGVALISSFPA